MVYYKDNWGQGRIEFGRELQTVYNFRVLDTDFTNWVIIYSCDDHPRSKPALVETESGLVQQKGTDIEIRVLTSVPGGVMDKEANKKLKEVLKNLEDLGKFVEVDQEGCEYNSDLV